MMTDMDSPTGKPLTGRKVFMMAAAAFSVIIGVNLTLAFQAVNTFPGLEVKNSYVASQSFDADRNAQLALRWDVSAKVEGDLLDLRIVKDGLPVNAKIVSATFGRATHVGEDQSPDFRFDGVAFRAPVKATGGNWNLRLVALAPDGTEFRQRVVVHVVK